LVKKNPAAPSTPTGAGSPVKGEAGTATAGFPTLNSDENASSTPVAPGALSAVPEDAEIAVEQGVTAGVPASELKAPFESPSHGGGDSGGASPSALFAEIEAAEEGQEPKADPESAGEGEAEGAVEVGGGEENEVEEPAALEEPLPAIDIPTSKAELLEKMDEVDGEISKMEARLKELKDADEAAREREAAGEEEELVDVLPPLPELHVGYKDHQGQVFHKLFTANQVKGRKAQRKLLMGRRLAPQEVLEKFAAGEIIYESIEELESYHVNIVKHKELVRPKLVRELLLRRQSLQKKEIKLRTQWHEINQKWLKKRKVKAAPPPASQGGRVRGNSVENNLPGRSPREMGVIRSDHDMEEIIAKLEADEHARTRFERNLAVIPAMILDVKERIARRFIDNNSLVEDPVHSTRLHTLVNTWQESEKKLFLEKFLSFPKNFRKIASYLPYKTPNDCVEYYYRTKKQLNYKDLVKEQNALKKKKAAEAQAKKGSLLAKRRNSEDGGGEHADAKPIKRAKTWTEADKQKFIAAMKEHGKDWKKLQKALGYSYAELRGLYTTWKDMIDPMLNAVAREKKRKAAAEREERELRAESEALKGANVEAPLEGRRGRVGKEEEAVKAEQPPQPRVDTREVPPAAVVVSAASAAVGVTAKAEAAPGPEIVE